MACKVSDLNELYPHDCDTLHQVRTQYADWRAILDKKLGYLRYYARLNDSQVMLYEHHLVARAAYGDIPAGYHVHHVNQVRTDNRAENLQVLSAREHALLHVDFRFLSQHGRDRASIHITITCENCGRPFRRAASQLNSHNFCSNTCRAIAGRKTNWPAAEALREILSTSSFRAAGRQFGVSDNTVRKWARLYGLI